MTSSQHFGVGVDAEEKERLRAVEVELAKLQTKVGVIWGVVMFIGGTIGSTLLVGVMTMLIQGAPK